MTVRQSLILGLLTMIIIPVLVTLVALSPESDPDAIPAVTATVRVGSVEQVVTALGKLEARQSVALNFVTAGKVSTIPVAAGQQVKVGDLLIQLDPTSAQNNLNQAQTAVEQAKVSLTELLLSPTANEISIAEATVISARGAYRALSQTASPDAIRTAELAYQQAQERVAALRQGRSVMTGDQPPEAYRLLDAQIGAASFEAEIARLRLVTLKRGSPAARAEAAQSIVLAELQLARIKLGTSPARIALAQAALRRAEIRLQEARAALEQTRLISPIDGVVLRVNAQTGQPTATDRPEIEIADISSLYFVANIDELDIGKLNPGMEAVVRVDALPNLKIISSIDQIALLSTLSNGIVTYPTRFQVSNPDPALKPGMTAQTTIVLTRRESVLLIPTVFVRKQDGHDVVLLTDGLGDTRVVNVVLGLTGREQAEVISGLNEGDLLVAPDTGEDLP